MLNAIIVASLLSMIQCWDSSEAVGDKMPDVLINAVLQRASFKSARFEMRLEERSPVVGRWTSNLTYEWAGEAQYVINHGNDDGIRLVDRIIGKVPLGVAAVALPEEIVIDRPNDVFWSHPVAYDFFARRPTSNWADYVDARIYGIMPIEHQNRDPRELLELLKSSSARYTQQTIRPHVVLVTRRETFAKGLGSIEIEWEIDEEKGPAIIRTSSYRSRGRAPRELVAEAFNELVKVDGFWWPAYVRSSQGETEINVSFQNIEFDRPTHRKSIDASTLNIPVGAMVDQLNERGVAETTFHVGGGATVSANDWKEIKDTHDLEPLKAFLTRTAAMGRGYYPQWWDVKDGTFGINGAADNPDLWESYVRRWTLKHTNNGIWIVSEPLTNEQRAAAKGILDDCRKRAAPVRARADAELARLEMGIKAIESELGLGARIPTSQQTGRPESSPRTKAGSSLIAQLAALQQHKANLTSSREIGRLFDELKQRLDNLLTSHQREQHVAADVKPRRAKAKPNEGRSQSRQTKQPQ